MFFFFILFSLPGHEYIVRFCETEYIKRVYNEMTRSDWLGMMRLMLIERNLPCSNSDQTFSMWTFEILDYDVITSLLRKAPMKFEWDEARESFRKKTD